MKVEQLMTREIEVCKVHETLNRAAQLMWERDCGFIPVIESNGDGGLVGVITDRDIAMATYVQGKPPLAIPLSRVMSRKPICCHVEDDIAQAEALMRTIRCAAFRWSTDVNTSSESCRSTTSRAKCSARREPAERGRSAAKGSRQHSRRSANLVSFTRAVLRWTWSM